MSDEHLTGVVSGNDGASLLTHFSFAYPNCHRYFFSAEFVDHWIVHVGGFLIDLLSGFGLCFRSTRPLTIVILLAFHGMNATMFTIGECTEREKRVWFISSLHIYYIMYTYIDDNETLRINKPINNLSRVYTMCNLCYTYVGIYYIVSGKLFKKVYINCNTNWLYRF